MISSFLKTISALFRIFKGDIIIARRKRKNDISQVKDVIYEENLYYRYDTICFSGEGRTLACYESHFGFRSSELNGKTVLDLGASSDLMFAKGLYELDIKAEVYSLSPDFYSDYHMQIAKNSFPEANIVAAVGQKMPFKDNMFDYIFASHVYEHVNFNVLMGIFLEVARTLKSGGIFKMGDIHDEFDYSPFKYFKDSNWLMNQLSLKGVVISQEFIPEEIAGSAFIRDSNGMSKMFVPFYNIVLTKK